MSDFIINVDFNASETGTNTKKEKKKHHRFLRRRRYLERKHLLKEKQCPPRNSNPGGNFNLRKKIKSQECFKPHEQLNTGCNNRTIEGKNNTLKNGFPQHMAPFKGAAPLGKTFQPLIHHSSLKSDVSNEALRGNFKGPPVKSHATATFENAFQPSPPHSILDSCVTKEALRVNFKAPSSSQAKASGSNCATSFPGHPQINLLSEFESGLPPVPSSATQSYKVVAIDCEMVGTGPKGSISGLARCSIVNWFGDVMYDKYILPKNPVTDYRTRWSGIRREHLRNATPFGIAQKEILKILTGKIVVGHAIHNDFKALNYFHPVELTRDTSKFPLLNQKAGFPDKETASLKRFAKQLLHKDIQTGSFGHSSVEDAKTTMELYRVVEVEWERELSGANVP
ncbi:hypothetical protein GDO86_016637 [Hymenochirus boettgeri]|uniref:Exonuclease XPMC2 n=1 Tax=Hymenochirus boettgeri TaxID=247094 RepID=A0A8T2K110_9PIPI|nr:hypothetical protein GDO86_016637 [Hymenochirus boettgeri]KAG8450028.1 hypothetical protein GDO86_016637 [Hymenochirus boettgeri]